MNLKDCQKSFITFIEDNYINYLKEYNIKKPFITTEFLDFDKFKYDFTCFIDFNRITFQNSSFQDDCRGSMQFNISVYLVHRNDTSENISERMLNASSAFYDLIDNEDFNGLLKSNINEINNYNIVEGTRYITISEFALTLEIETN